jgi:hypothetical protein
MRVHVNHNEFTCKTLSFKRQADQLFVFTARIVQKD